MLSTGRLYLVFDLQRVITLYSFGLNPHFRGVLPTNDVPFPIRTALGLLPFGKCLEINKARMPPPDLHQVAFGNRLLSIADVFIRTMCKLQVA